MFHVKKKPHPQPFFVVVLLLVGGGDGGGGGGGGGGEYCIVTFFFVEITLGPLVLWGLYGITFHKP